MLETKEVGLETFKIYICTCMQKTYQICNNEILVMDMGMELLFEL